MIPKCKEIKEIRNVEIITNYVYDSDFAYSCFKFGKLVVLNIYTIAFKKPIDTGIVFMTGLPKPTNYVIFYMQGGNDATGYTARCGITTEGGMSMHYSTPIQYGDSSNKQYSCTLVYKTID